MGTNVYIRVSILLLNCLSLFKFAENSEKIETRICANPECSEPISEAVGAVQYNANTEDGVSFKKKSKILVYSKPAEDSIMPKDKWVVKVNGKLGFVRKNLLAKHRILKKDTVIVKQPVSFFLKNNQAHVESLNINTVNENQISSDSSENIELNVKTGSSGSVFGMFPTSFAETVKDDIKKKINPNKVEEVIDGTTIRKDLDEDDFEDPYYDEQYDEDDDIDDEDDEENSQQSNHDIPKESVNGYTTYQSAASDLGANSTDKYENQVIISIDDSLTKDFNNTILDKSANFTKVNETIEESVNTLQKDFKSDNFYQVNNTKSLEKTESGVEEKHLEAQLTTERKNYTIPNHLNDIDNKDRSMDNTKINEFPNKQYDGDNSEEAIKTKTNNAGDNSIKKIEVTADEIKVPSFEETTEQYEKQNPLNNDMVTDTIEDSLKKDISNLSISNFDKKLDKLKSNESKIKSNDISQDNIETKTLNQSNTNDVMHGYPKMMEENQFTKNNDNDNSQTKDGNISNITNDTNMNRSQINGKDEDKNKDTPNTSSSILHQGFTSSFNNSHTDTPNKILNSTLNSSSTVLGLENVDDSLKKVKDSEKSDSDASNIDKKFGELNETEMKSNDGKVIENIFDEKNFVNDVISQDNIETKTLNRSNTNDVMHGYPKIMEENHLITKNNDKDNSQTKDKNISDITNYTNMNQSQINGMDEDKNKDTPNTSSSILHQEFISSFDNSQTDASNKILNYTLNSSNNVLDLEKFDDSVKESEQAKIPNDSSKKSIESSSSAVTEKTLDENSGDYVDPSSNITNKIDNIAGYGESLDDESNVNKQVDHKIEHGYEDSSMPSDINYKTIEGFNEVEVSAKEENIHIGDLDTSYHHANNIPEEVIVDNSIILESTTESISILHNRNENEEEENLTSILGDDEPVAAVADETSYSWFSFSVFDSLFSSSSETVEEMDRPHKNENQFEYTTFEEKPTLDGDQYCYTKENGDKTCEDYSSVVKENLDVVVMDQEDYWTILKDYLLDSQVLSLSSDSVVYLVITSITVILFSLGYYYIENRRNDNKYIAKINQLERDLLVSKKEIAMLTQKLESTEGQVTVDNDSLNEYIEKIEVLTADLEETKAAKLELEEQCATLEKECEAATESGLEMHRLLSESFSNQDGSQVLFQTVENLREKIDHQDSEIKELNQLLRNKSDENEKLIEEANANKEAIKALRDKLHSFKRNKEEEILKLKKSNVVLSNQVGDLTEEKSLVETKLSNDISKLRLLIEETQTTLSNRENEIDLLKDAIAKLNKHDKEENLEALYNTAEVASRLAVVEKERNNYKEKFIEEEGARKLLEDHVQMTRQEINTLKENYETAEKEKIEALTKLQVLSNYFKEKESELQKELGTQESMWLQKQSDDHSIYEQMKSLREENEKFKLQNESLKKEICESESAFKSQISNAEQKAHDNWLASRQMERKLKETQNEAMQLRNRLTLVENKNAANSSSDDLKQSYSIGETNGDPSSPPPSMPIFPSTASPPFMMYGGNLPPPLPPSSEFLPPPPLPPIGFPEGRPAPVGRISSPPLDQSFSPPPPLYFYDTSHMPMYSSHHSPSPPPHRPMPKSQRDLVIEQKGPSSPSRHSEQHDKPIRRSKR